VANVERSIGNKNKSKEKNMQRYVIRKEKPIIKFMREMEENKRMKKMNKNMIEQIEQMRKKWKEKKLEMEKRRKK